MYDVRTTMVQTAKTFEESAPIALENAPFPQGFQQEL
jgi:hypothetical protein